MAIGTLGFGEQVVNQIIPASGPDVAIRPLLVAIPGRSALQLSKGRVYRIQPISGPVNVHWAGQSLGAGAGLLLPVDGVWLDDSPLAQLWASGGSFLIQVHE